MSDLNSLYRQYASKYFEVHEQFQEAYEQLQSETKRFKDSLNSYIKSTQNEPDALKDFLSLQPSQIDNDKMREYKENNSELKNMLQEIKAVNEKYEKEIGFQMEDISNLLAMVNREQKEICEMINKNN